MNTVNYTNNLSFSSRCKEIKLGDQICRKVNKEFGSISPRKFVPYIDKNCDGKYKKQVSPGRLMMLIIKYSNGRFNPGDNCTENLRDIIAIMKEHRQADCYEKSVLANLALRLNGIKNAYIASVKTCKNDLDHVVCLFNRDGSEFKEIINNKTIIVDPWADKCDFANNLLQEYNFGILSKYFKNAGKHQKLSLDEIEQLNLSPSELEGYREQLSKFCINS